MSILLILIIFNNIGSVGNVGNICTISNICNIAIIGDIGNTRNIIYLRKVPEECFEKIFGKFFSESFFLEKNPRKFFYKVFLECYS